jgi:hypothetical protein
MSARTEMFAIVPGRNDRGEHVFCVILKRTYRIGAAGAVERAERDHEFLRIDQYYEDGDPEWSTVEYEAELAPYKPSTDVVVIGSAHAPDGLPTQQMSVGVQVGSRKKSLLVSGDRHCAYREGQLPLFTDPVPFTRMAINYQRAYGGRDERSIPDIPFHYPRNFMGKGMVLRNVQHSVDGLALPNIEDPQDPLTPERLFMGEPERWHLQPLPQGFGWRQRTWYPRCALLGVYPPFTAPGTVTAEERMGLVPRNHIALAKQSRLPPLESHFNNGASLGLIFSNFQHDSEIVLTGLTPAGTLKFALPADMPRIGLDVGSGMQALEPRLHTVSVRPDAAELDMIWRGAYVYPGYAWLPNMKRLHAEVH